MSHETAGLNCPDLSDLEEFLSAGSRGESSSRVEKHLSTCAGCRVRLEEVRQNLQLMIPVRDAFETLAAKPVALPPPQTIGSYRILRKLGEGGMGTVFEAEQENPRRLVALKVIRPGRMSTTMLRRFRHEMQMLGRLQHPGIAQVYEGGTHSGPDGPVPYFVMELIDGSPLLRFARSRSLPARDRLELMARVCDAVQHAHEKGIVHRDLKPGNILVTETAGVPTPKILDFGVARAIDPELQITTMQTEVGQIVGTVAYMSPEQVSGKSSEVDARSDVYALGVICYELLADKLPHDMAEKSLPELAWLIHHDDPTPLSVVDRTYRGDVETIVTKAMEKEKTRRYQSAAEIAADIRRFLRDEPIVARPPSTMYQLRKFARRNKALVGGVLTAFALLILGIAGTTIGLVRAEHARVAAEHSAAEARREAGKAQAVNRFLNEMLGSANPYLTRTEVRGREVTVLETLDAAAAKIDKGSLKDQPEIEAAVRTTLGSTYVVLGEYRAAEPHLQRALEINRQLHGGSHHAVADSLTSLGTLYVVQARHAEAEPLLESALAIHAAPAGQETAEVAEALSYLALIKRDQGHLPEAEAILERVLAARRRLLGSQHERVANTLQSLAIVRNEQGRYVDAEALFREALAILREALGEDHLLVAACRNELGETLYFQGKYAEAEPLYRQVLELRLKLLGEDHYEVASTCNDLGSLLLQERRFDEAEPLLRQALATYQRMLGDDHPQVSVTTNNLGMLLLTQRRFSEAEPLLRESLAMRRRRHGDEHRDVAEALNSLGGVLKEQSKSAEAEPLFREAVAMSRRTHGENHPQVALALHNLSQTVKELGRSDEAAPLSQQAVTISVAALGEEHPYTSAFRLGLATAIRERGDPDEAEALCRQVLDRSIGRFGNDHPSTAAARGVLGACLSDLKRFEEAEGELVAAERVFRSQFGDNDKQTVLATQRLISLYEAWGKDDQASRLRASLPTSGPHTQPTETAGQ